MERPMQDEKAKRILEIDENDLLSEWKKQPLLYAKAAARAVNFRYEYLTSKMECERMEAILAIKIRNDPSDYGVVGRVSEGLIADMVTKRDEVVEKRREVSEKEYKMREAEGFVRAIEQRKTALEQIVHLQTMEMFSEPNGQKYRFMGKTEDLVSRQINNELRNKAQKEHNDE